MVYKLYRFLVKNLGREQARAWRSTLETPEFAPIANDYITLLESTQTYTNLLIMDNIGIERNNMDSIRNIANQVGLEIPKTEE